MPEDSFDYKTLRRIQELEKRSPTLTKINPAFYQQLSEFLTTLKKQGDHEKNTQKIKLYRDEIQNTEKIAKNIYELREKKIMQAALSKIRGGKPDMKNLLDVEQTLYDALVDLIQSNRKKIFHSSHENPANTPKINTRDSADVHKKDSDTNTKPIVRVTKDLPGFIGTDEVTYHLRQNDVLSLSKEMSDLLQKRNAAKKIENG